MSMIRGLNIRTGTALAIVLTLLAVGIVYAVQIERTVTGFGAIGQVQTVEETVLLWGSLDPRTELVQVDFGEMDVDAFGNLVTEVRFPLWVENGGGTPFALTVEAANVTVTPPGTGSRAAPGALGLLFGPAGGRLRPAPEHVVVLAPGPENAIAGELMLEFLVAPEELGPTGTQLSLDIVFVADDELPRPPPPPQLRHQPQRRDLHPHLRPSPGSVARAGSWAASWRSATGSPVTEAGCPCRPS